MVRGALNVRFCPTCGATVQYREIEQRQRAVCAGCGRIHYDQLKVGAGALIEQDGRLLLLQRAEEPFRHQWNLPAGYTEADESPAETAVREVYEEAGLRVAVDRLVDVYFYTDDPRGNGILIVYQCRVVGGTLGESLEGVNPTFFARDEIPAELAGGGHNQAIRAWQKRREVS